MVLVDWVKGSPFFIIFFMNTIISSKTINAQYLFKSCLNGHNVEMVLTKVYATSNFIFFYVLDPFGESIMFLFCFR